MSTLIETVSWDGGFTFYRAPEAGRRALRIRLVPADGGDHRELGLPADMNHLDVSGFAPGSVWEVTAKPASLAARLRLRGQKLQVSAKDRPFRVLVSGSGRCGTQTLAQWLDGMGFRDGTTVDARHESLARHLLPAIVEGDLDRVGQAATGQGHDIESSPFYCLTADRLRAGRVVLLIRDGRRVVQSGMNRGWYDNDTLWNRIKPRFSEDRFTNCCRFWHHANAELEQVADLTVRLEDLATDPAVQAQFLSDLEIEAGDVPFPHANKGQASSAATDWTQEQRQIFTETCGDLMDRHYPRWQEDW